MRRCWFGDDRDLWKWTVAIREARERNAEILYVAMMQEDNEQSVYDPAVLKFFRGERCFEALKQLAESVELNIESFLAVYSRLQWRAYFAPVLSHLHERSASQRSVLLIDPDTGLWSAKPKACHVRKDEIQLLWESMRLGDVMLIYQHQQRKSEWHNSSGEKLGHCLSVEAQGVRSLRQGDVALLAIEKA